MASSDCEATSGCREPAAKRRVHVQATKSCIDISSRTGVFSLTRDMIKCFFDLSAAAAAKVLGVCLTVLKNMRRWMGIVRWPFDAVNRGLFIMSRDEIVELRLGMIARLEAGGEGMSKFQRVLPMLREAVALGVGYKAISASTVYAAPTAYAMGMVNLAGPAQVMQRPTCGTLEASTAYAFGVASRVGGPQAQVKEAAHDVKPKSAQAALAARVVAGVFKRPVAQRRVNWVSQGAMCLSDTAPDCSVMGGSGRCGPVTPLTATRGGVPEAESPAAPAVETEAVAFETELAPAVQSVESTPVTPGFCPYAYARDCATPAWVEPAYPPASHATDNIAAIWPVMQDPRRIWMQELIYRSLVPNNCGPGIRIEELLQPAPMNAAEACFVDSFFDGLCVD